MAPSIHTHLLYGRLTQGTKRAMLQAQRQTLGVPAHSLEQAIHTRHKTLWSRFAELLDC